MSTLTDLLAEHTSMTGEHVTHLQRVVAEWQLLADLSFADFLLWIPLSGNRFLCVAQARPTTAPTAHLADLVGTTVDVAEHPQLPRAIAETRICREEDPQWDSGVPLRREAIPVLSGAHVSGAHVSGGHGEVIAVLGRDTNLAMPRVPSQLEIAYLGSAADLCQMIADGTFPTDVPVSDIHTSPRVGDGLIRLDPSGAVVYASPNAASAYHRMGHAAELTGARLDPLTRGLIPDPFDAKEVSARVLHALDGGASTRFEAETGRGAVVLFRALPLRPKGKPAGALVLVRDVTEVKRRDRALLSKDAMIREIHHRVKNNLQTVAALLRLQSRRLSNVEARLALDESVRRVNAIALVHEALSGSVDEQVDMDDLLNKVLPMLGEVSAPESDSASVSVRRHGSFGVVPAELATPLVMVLAELVQNAIEHGYPDGERGSIEVRVARSARWLDVVVSDAGAGLPEDFSLAATHRLGLQIVRTLVDAELRGSLELRRRQPRGTDAVLRVPMRHRR
ncbi:MAG: PAS domain-containing sensor histidine kinase [Sciscionella sp.]|nr:PAS domain-containing sensor histidine kinase [Sciscionella sp.]